uniref:Uncharacterized protein n=1 Tax=Arundo donax TaxID=35708 RepID=A0A0A9GBM3_ARUDO
MHRLVPFTSIQFHPTIHCLESCAELHIVMGMLPCVNLEPHLELNQHSPKCIILCLIEAVELSVPRFFFKRPLNCTAVHCLEFS